MPQNPLGNFFRCLVTLELNNKPRSKIIFIASVHTNSMSVFMYTTSVMYMVVCCACPFIVAFLLTKSNSSKCEVGSSSPLAPRKKQVVKKWLVIFLSLFFFRANKAPTPAALPSFHSLSLIAPVQAIYWVAALESSCASGQSCKWVKRPSNSAFPARRLWSRARFAGAGFPDLK